MLKKAEVIEALENGGMISVDSIYRCARVLDADYNEIGTCRYDTAERIERSEGYKRRKTSWFAHWFVEKDWDAVSARVMAAVTETFQALERSGVISDLEIEPMTAAQIAEASAALEAAEAAEEAPAAHSAQKSYINAATDEGTLSATEALRWHRRGDPLTVYTWDGERFTRAVHVQGAPQEQPASRDNENWEHCRRIADDIDAYVNGEYKRCPDCGEIHRRDWGDVGDVFRCPECGEIADVDDWEPLSVYDFLADYYDIEYRCGSRKDFRSVRIMVACGGPNIYLDTASKDVELYWWTESARYPMSYEAAAALDDWAEEMWGCL